MWPAKSSLKPESAGDFLSHFEELRRRLLIGAGAFFLAALFSFFFSRPLLDFLIRPLQLLEPDTSLFFQSPHEAFLTHVKIAALAGLILASPVWITQAWLFVSPGLYSREKKILLPWILVSISLFLFGAVFAYLVVIPWGLNFLLSFQTESLKPWIGISPYFSFLTGMVLAFALLFNFPVVVVGLVSLGILNLESLKRARRAVIVLIFIVAAILTPTPDPFSQLLLALPLLVLFELSLLIAGKGSQKT